MWREGLLQLSSEVTEAADWLFFVVLRELILDKVWKEKLVLPGTRIHRSNEPSVSTLVMFTSLQHHLFVLSPTPMDTSKADFLWKILALATMLWSHWQQDVGWQS